VLRLPSLLHLKEQEPRNDSRASYCKRVMLVLWYAGDPISISNRIGMGNGGGDSSTVGAGCCASTPGQLARRNVQIFLNYYKSLNNLKNGEDLASVVLNDRNVFMSWFGAQEGRLNMPKGRLVRYSNGVIVACRYISEAGFESSRGNFGSMALNAQCEATFCPSFATLSSDAMRLTANDTFCHLPYGN
jgi:hypothetical protein